MAAEYDLERFVKAQSADYDMALAEIKAGRKRSHWMWYIFPQIAGLGHSDMAKYYAIQNLNEAQAYLQHPTLGPRLIEISNALLNLHDNNATAILGQPDDMKLHSSMTLFSLLKNTDPVFRQVLDKFFDGQKDEKTVGRVSP